MFGRPYLDSDLIFKYPLVKVVIGLIVNYKTNQWRILIARACLAFLAASLIYLGVTLTDHHSASAQSDITLKSDIITLKARISRLEQEVSRLRSANRNLRQPSVPRQQSPPAKQNRENSSIANERFVTSSDPMFDRLATLVIELKEDVRNIDQRLTKIEKLL